MYFVSMHGDVIKVVVACIVYTSIASHELISFILQLLWLGFWRHWLKLMNVMGELL